MLSLQKRATRLLFQQSEPATPTKNRFTEFAELYDKLCLSPQEAKVNYPNNGFDHVYSDKESYLLELPFSGAEKLTLPLPLPQISR